MKYIIKTTSFLYMLGGGGTVDFFAHTVLSQYM